MYFFEYEHLNVLFDKIIIFCPFAKYRESGTFSELAVISAFSFQIFTKFLIKKDSVMSIFCNMSTWKVLFEKMITFSPISGISGIGHIFQAGGDKCFLCKSRKTHTSTFILFVSFHSLDVNLLFNSRIFTIEPF